jgi:hypothetical protein
MLARWFLPVIAVLAMLVSSATSWAAAGPTGDLACCCPDPETCKCNHDDSAPHPKEIKRCGGEMELVGVATLAAVAVDVIDPTMIHCISNLELPVHAGTPDRRYLEIEIPPF